MIKEGVSSLIFDGHSDIFTDVLIRRLEGETQILNKYHLPRLRKGNIDGGCFVLWIDPPYAMENPADRMEQLLRAVSEELHECKDACLVHNLADIQAARAQGRFYILLGLEGLSAIGEDLDGINRLYDFGARHAMLTWNEQNALATGVQGECARGLTDLGKRAVRRIQDLGMILDVSHLNERSFWDVMALANGPIIASHSNARALADAARNLKDDQLKAIRDTDGLIGLNSFNLFVSQTVSEQTIDRFVDHAVYIAEKIGVEHVGFGFDFFEFISTDKMRSYSDQDTSYTVGMEDCTKVPTFMDKLKKAGFSDAELAQIAYKNWYRVIEKVLG